jgi:hypothetical protein
LRHTIRLLTNIILLASLFTVPSAIQAGHPSVAGPSLVINTSLKEARPGSVLLDINWYIEQDNLAVRPTEASIIAILIGARGKEYKGLANISISAGGPLSGSARVALSHDEHYSAPTDARFVVTVTLKRNGSARSLPSRTKEFVLRVNETQ